MHIQLNDESVVCEQAEAVNALLKRLDLLKPGVALAVNQRILPRTRWDEHQLQDGDHLLLFQVIAGG